MDTIRNRRRRLAREEGRGNLARRVTLIETHDGLLHLHPNSAAHAAHVIRTAHPDASLLVDRRGGRVLALPW